MNLLRPLPSPLRLRSQNTWADLSGMRCNRPPMLKTAQCRLLPQRRAAERLVTESGRACLVFAVRVRQTSFLRRLSHVSLARLPLHRPGILPHCELSQKILNNDRRAENHQSSSTVSHASTARSRGGKSGLQSSPHQATFHGLGV